MLAQFIYFEKKLASYCVFIKVWPRASEFLGALLKMTTPVWGWGYLIHLKVWESLSWTHIKIHSRWMKSVDEWISVDIAILTPVGNMKEYLLPYLQCKIFYSSIRKIWMHKSKKAKDINTQTTKERKRPISIWKSAKLH